MTRLPRIISRLVCLGVMLGQIAGCATFHIPFSKKIPKASASDPVVQILCLWQQAEGRDPDGYPCKGFSGQILFLSSKAATPVQCEGDVRIYLFDDLGTPEEQTKPLRQFDFDSGSWKIHLTETSLGPTYSVFVPYVRRGVKDANCALRVRLKPSYGQFVFSDLSNMPLNGNKKPLSGPEAKPFSEEETNTEAAAELASRLHRTTTISLGANPKVTDSLALAKKPESTSAIQLMSHEVPAEVPKESAESKRIRQLEAMVKQLMEQKSAPPVVPAAQPAAQSPAQPAAPPQVLDLSSVMEKIEPEKPKPDRLRMTARNSPARNDQGEEPKKRTTPARQKHLLED
ncbi:hypothetical protein [Schlesneria sp. T3-172]|uniref:hypothetical protein n=1 Tax=Schlesneria sphaerica TaxID=3373610 RepID=UPI0037C8E1C1